MSAYLIPLWIIFSYGYTEARRKKERKTPHCPG